MTGPFTADQLGGVGETVDAGIGLLELADDIASIGGEHPKAEDEEDTGDEAHHGDDRREGEDA